MASPARMAVLRSALLFSPFLAITLAALGFIVAEIATEGAGAGRIVGTVLVSGVALLLAYQVVQSLRDLFSRPVATEGLVERRWSRNELLIFRNTYIFVERNVFRLEPEQALEVELGDTVRIVHYPHTCTVESIEVTSQGGARRGSIDE